jgi:hypothetical protein
MFLVVGTMGAYYGLLEGPAASMDALGTNPFTSAAVLNLVLSAAIMIASYLLRRTDVQQAMRARR